jgi:hypothetical protein
VASDLAINALISGHVHVLAWLVEHGDNMVESSYSQIAAEWGHLHVLQWMMEQGLVLSDDEYLCSLAAGGGNLAALQWLHTLGCPFDAARCTEEVKYAIERQQERNGATEDYEEVLNWLCALHTKQPGTGRRIADPPLLAVMSDAVRLVVNAPMLGGSGAQLLDSSVSERIRAPRGGAARTCTGRQAGGVVERRRAEQGPSRSRVQCIMTRRSRGKRETGDWGENSVCIVCALLSCWLVRLMSLSCLRLRARLRAAGICI